MQNDDACSFIVVIIDSLLLINLFALIPNPCGFCRVNWININNIYYILDNGSPPPFFHFQLDRHRFAVFDFFFLKNFYASKKQMYHSGIPAFLISIVLSKFS